MIGRAASVRTAVRGVIDLGTPTPKKKRTDLDDALSQMLEEDGVTGAAAASGSAGAPA